MAERKRAASPKQVTSAAKKRAQAENLAKGREAKARKRAEAKAAQESGEVRMTAGERWSMLISGTLTVQDLDDEELASMRMRGIDGTFNGRGRAIPSHIAQAMQHEAIKRAQAMFQNAAPAAVKRLIEIASDPDTKDADAIRALQLVMERSLGKVPDTVRVETQDAWGKLLREASPEQVDRSLADDA